MKKILFIYFIYLNVAYSQSVTINPQATGTGIINAQSTQSGMMVPRMTSTQRSAVQNPGAGLVVFDNSTNTFWYHNGTVWVEISAGGPGQWQQNGSDLQNTNTGNVGIGINPTKAKFEVHTTSTTQAIFGSQSTGISLQKDHPTIGFNQYRDGNDVQRYIGDGFAMGNFFDQLNGILVWTIIPPGSAGNPTISETTAMVLREGNLGIGTPTPQARLHVAGYSKLGVNSPGIQLKSLTGTISCLSNNCTDNIPHGLNAAKILDISIVINCSDTNGNLNLWVEPSDCTSQHFGYCYYYSFDNTNIIIRHPNSGTANTLGKPYKILITYQE